MSSDNEVRQNTGVSMAIEYAASPTPMPVMFIPHGGGPLPLLGDEHHKPLAQFLSSVAATLPPPNAILLVTAHWESENVSLSSSAAPSMIYDYHGFDAKAYQLQYRADGAPQLAKSVQDLLQSKGIAVTLDDHRGFDHGAFVPLMLMYPEANIPVLQMSLVHSLDAEKHIAIGEALSELRSQGVLILGSGMSFHNMRAFFSGGESGRRFTF